VDRNGAVKLKVLIASLIIGSMFGAAIMFGQVERGPVIRGEIPVCGPTLADGTICRYQLPARILLMGDSLSSSEYGIRQAFCDELAESGLNAVTVGEGRGCRGLARSGYQVAELAPLASQAIWYKPDVILLQVGINDLAYQRHTAIETATAVRNLAHELTALSPTVRVLIGIAEPVCGAPVDPYQLDTFRALERAIADGNRIGIVELDNVDIVCPGDLSDVWHPGFGRPGGVKISRAWVNGIHDTIPLGAN